jgi:hypothetical protein
MEQIKRFFWDETASAEATSTVLLIGAVSIFLGAALVIWWDNVTSFFTSAGTAADALGGRASDGMGALQ